MRYLAFAAVSVVTSASAQELINERELFESGEEHGSMAFSPDGRRLLTAGSFSPVKVRDGVSGTTLATIEESAFIYTMAISPDGKLLATAIDRDSEQLIRLRELPEGRVVADLDDSGSSLAFTPDSRTLISEHDGTEIRLWDVDSGKLVSTLAANGHAIAISPDGKLLACAGTDSIEIWKLDSEETVDRFEVKVSLDLEFSPDGDVLAYCTGAEIRLRDLDADNDTRVLRSDDDDRIDSISFAPSGRRIASARLNGQVELWDTKSGKVVASERCGPCGLVAFSPTGTVLAHVNGIQDYSQSVTLWDVRGGSD